MGLSRLQKVKFIKVSGHEVGITNPVLTNVNIGLSRTNKGV